MRYSWILDVLRDMQRFSREYGFREVERKIGETIAAAEAEIPTKVLRDLDHLAAQEGWDVERSAIGGLLRSFEAGPQATQSSDAAAWQEDREAPETGQSGQSRDAAGRSGGGTR